MTKKIAIWFLFLSILFMRCSSAVEKFWSLKNSKVNVRYGPSLNSKIKYIYKKINLPVKQIDEKEFNKLWRVYPIQEWNNIQHAYQRPSSSNPNRAWWNGEETYLDIEK